MKRSFWVICLLALSSVSAQTNTKVYKFSKAFVAEHYKRDSAIGILHTTQAQPAATVHTRSCDGKDGELHIGVEGTDIRWSKQGEEPVSALATEVNSNFGVVAEPPNVSPAAQTKINAIDGQPVDFIGYFRVWNEGHDVGRIYPSNPHHVLEVHPAWILRSGGRQLGTPTVVAPIPGFSGYGASKFVPMLSGVKNWLRVAEGNEFIYVQLTKQDNFYQLPAVVKSVKPVTGGVEATVDVYSDVGGRLIYPNLAVVMARGSQIAGQVAQAAPNSSIYLLGFFSVNLWKAAMLARGHPTSAPAAGFAALEFFAFGVPLQKAVMSSACDVEVENVRE